MLVVEVLDFRRGDDDIGIYRIIDVGGHHEIHIGHGVVLLDGLLQLQGVLEGGSREQGAVLGGIAVDAHQVLEIVADLEHLRVLLAGCSLQEIADQGGRHIAVLVPEQTAGSNYR